MSGCKINWPAITELNKPPEPTRRYKLMNCVSLWFGKVSEATWFGAVAVQITGQVLVWENRIHRDAVSMILLDEIALRRFSRSCPLTDGVAVMVHRSAVSD